MAGFEERKRFWNIFYSPLVFILLLVLFVFLARAMWSVYNHEQVSERDRERAENELIVSSQQAAALKGQVKDLQTTQGIDDAIRAKFNVTKDGEGVAVIVNATNSVNTTTSQPTTEKSWWQKFTGIFGL